MTERPIIMGPFSVRAFLAGRKTQTRRIISKLRQFGKITEFGPSSTPGYDWHFRDKEKRWNDTRHAYFLKALPYVVGDRLWVREALNVAAPGSSDWQYRADASPIRMMQDDPRASEMAAWAHHKDGEFCSSIHMPKWAASSPTVTEVRIQRLQDISRDDAMDEGIVQTWGELHPEDRAAWAIRAMERAEAYDGIVSHYYDNRRSVENYALLWDSLHGPGSWAANPWIMALSLTVEQAE